MSSYNSLTRRNNARSPSSATTFLTQGHSYGDDQDNSSRLSSTNSPKMEVANADSLQVNGDGNAKKRSSASDYIIQIQQENESLRREVDMKESKLQSNMNSIKTFWSPELKKERSLRKEESTRATILREQLKSSQDENQNLQLTVQALQDELRAQRDLNQLLQDDMSGSQAKDLNLSSGNFSIDTRILQEEVDRLTRENELLQRTMEEMESRIEAQRQTLDSRDESIRKLLEMLQSKALSQQDDAENETDSLRMQLVEAEARLAQLDSLIMERNCEISQLKKNGQLPANVLPEDMPKIQSLQAVISMKDGKLAILERDLNLLEEEMAQLKRDGGVTSEERQEELKQLELFKGHSSFMKSKIEQLKCDLQKKDTMLVTMQTKLDTLNNQQSDSRQHIDVLKESLAAKEQRAAILQAEVDSLRTRLDEKQQILDRKQEQLTVMQEERSSSGSEVAHLQDTLEVKDRKIIVLHRKIESLAEVVREKDKQMELIKERLMVLQHDTSNNDSVLATMEEALTDKERLLKTVQAEFKTGEEKWREDAEKFKKERMSLEKACESLRQELAEKEASLSDLKEHASSLASAGLKKDSQIKQIEINLQKTSEKLVQAESQLKKTEEDHQDTVAQSEAESNKVKRESEKKIAEIEKLAKEKDEEAKKCQSDLDRLLEILKETENEKHEKDKRIGVYDKQMKELQAKVKSLQNKMVEESKLKGAAHTKDTAQFLTQIKVKDERIEELEEALRQSVSITAERETVLTREQDNVRKLQRQHEDIVKQLKNSQQVLEQTGSKLTLAEAAIHEKDRHLQTLKVERRKQLEELMEMKQETLLSAISEKDANIALLELSASRKKANNDEVQLLKREKDNLVAQLKQQTQNRLKLMQDNFEDNSTTRSSSKGRISPRQKKKGTPSTRGANGSNHRPNSKEDDGEGIWA